MASFRKRDKQVAHCVRKINALGEPRAHAKKIDKVSSVRTLENYRTVYSAVSKWMASRGYDYGLHRLHTEHATEYLHERATCVTQKTLDGETAALRKLTRANLPRVHSTYVPARILANESRAYARDELERIRACQSERNALATRVAYEAGLRGAELLTLRRFAERGPSVPEKWDAQRWIGKENWSRFTVCGKGGLVREVRLSLETARELEARRCSPHEVVDRKIRCTTVYDIGGGNAWARSFSDASLRALGVSRGAHGVRHAFVREEVERFVALGFGIRDAKRLTSQLVGHWRQNIIAVYLR